MAKCLTPGLILDLRDGGGTHAHDGGDEVGWVLVRMKMREGMHPMCIGRMLMKNCVCATCSFPIPIPFTLPFMSCSLSVPFCHSSPLPQVVSFLVLVRMRMREGMEPKCMERMLMGKCVMGVRMGVER